MNTGFQEGLSELMRGADFLLTFEPSSGPISGVVGAATPPTQARYSLAVAITSLGDNPWRCASFRHSKRSSEFCIDPLNGVDETASLWESELHEAVHFGARIGIAGQIFA
jgi:hypothetical protein